MKKLIINKYNNCENEWDKVEYFFKKKFNVLDGNLETILIIIGIQILGKGFIKLNKDEKINIIHIAVCTILIGFGFYKNIGVDRDGWPHFKILKKIPYLKENEQKILIKNGIIDYMKHNNYI